MSKPKRQHWVPQFYLRHFAIPETKGGGADRVWAFSRDKSASPEVHQIGVKNAALEGFLYSPKNVDGTRDFAMESRLGNLEGFLAPFWDRFATEFLPLGDAERKAVSLFLATLYLRHPERRQLVKANHQRMVEFFESEFRKLGYVPKEIQLIRKGKPVSFSTDRFEEWKNSDDNDHHKHFVDFIRSDTIVIARLLLKKRWSVVFSDKPVFVTSDNPLVMEGPAERPERFGFGTPGMKILFPISPHRLLRLADDDENDGKYCPLLEPEDLPIAPWSIFNWQIWVNAYRFLFSPRHCDGVLREIVAFVDWAHSQAREQSEES